MESYTLGERIRYARQVAHYPRGKQFAAALGITASALSGYETGRSVPSSPMLERISTLSGRSMRWLLTGEEGPPAVVPASCPVHGVIE